MPALILLLPAFAMILDQSGALERKHHVHAPAAIVRTIEHMTLFDQPQDTITLVTDVAQ